MSLLATNDLNKLRPEEILELRFCDLPLSVRDSQIEQRVDRLYGELDERELPRPHVWLSEEWFTPDGVCGFAIPFYLAHPRLTRLERVMMFEAEGDAEDECMRILRHEAGHALANAFRLQRTRPWKKLFGSNSIAYPQWYRPSLTSRDFVLNLNAWYAQAHPAEDFAETFAVWLRPSSDWRSRYKGWNALHKLEYVHHAMMAMRGRSTQGRRREVEPLSSNRKTLGEHYLKKREFYSPEWPDSYDRSLARVFSAQPTGKNPSASQVLRSVRREVCASVTARTGMHPYTVDHIMNDIIRRSRELGLRRKFSERETRLRVDALLTNQVRQALKTGYRRIPL
jgi:hypothetical protein